MLHPSCAGHLSGFQLPPPPNSQVLAGRGLGTEHLEPRFLNFRVLKRRDSKLTSFPSAALDMGSLGKRWGPDWRYGGGGCLYSKGSSLVKLTG